MNRFSEIKKFVEFDFSKNIIIEPKSRYLKLKEMLFEVIDTYNPQVIVKAGLGNGKLLFEIAENYDSLVVVVEPSYDNVKNFLELHKGSGALEQIKFIVGNFEEFPVDYYAANLLINIDMFDFIESNKVLDEFRRAIEFESILFIASVVLHEDDIEGVYDDFMKVAFPIHNDYYLEVDLKTFMDLNEFKFIKGKLEYFEENIPGQLDYFDELYNSKKDALDFIKKNREDFNTLYGFNENIVNLPYFSGIFMRNKIQPKDSKL
ncbi:methyltransferase domain-containing protein [Spirochaetota bacterium]